MEQVSCKIDWLTITGKASLSDVEHGQLNVFTAEKFAKDRLSYLLQDFQALTQVKGNGFYQYCFEDQVTHVRIEISENLSHQGWKFTMPGGAVIEETERQRILQRAVDANMAVTRVDVAVDMVNSLMEVETVYRMYEREKHTGRALAHDFKKRLKGDTFYIGSRESAYFLRVYDKGKEQGLAEPWIRYEIELKDYAAKGYAGTIAFDPALAAREIIRMLDLPGSRVEFLLKRLLDDVERERPKTPYSAPDLEVWFRETVSAAFRNLCKQDYDAAGRVLEGLNGYHIAGFLEHMNFEQEQENRKNG